MSQLLNSLTLVVCTYCYSGIRKKTDVKPPVLPALDSPQKNTQVSIYGICLTLCCDVVAYTGCPKKKCTQDF